MATRTIKNFKTFNELSREDAYKYFEKHFTGGSTVKGQLLLMWLDGRAKHRILTELANIYKADQELNSIKEQINMLQLTRIFKDPSGYESNNPESQVVRKPIWEGKDVAIYVIHEGYDLYPIIWCNSEDRGFYPDPYWNPNWTTRKIHSNAQFTKKILETITDLVKTDKFTGWFQTVK